VTLRQEGAQKFRPLVYYGVHERRQLRVAGCRRIEQNGSLTLFRSSAPLCGMPLAILTKLRPRDRNEDPWKTLGLNNVDSPNMNPTSDIFLMELKRRLYNALKEGPPASHCPRKAGLAEFHEPIGSLYELHATCR